MLSGLGGVHAHPPDVHRLPLWKVRDLIRLAGFCDYVRNPCGWCFLPVGGVVNDVFRGRIEQQSSRHEGQNRCRVCGDGIYLPVASAVDDTYFSPDPLIHNPARRHAGTGVSQCCGGCGGSFAAIPVDIYLACRPRIQRGHAIILTPQCKEVLLPQNIHIGDAVVHRHGWACGSP